VENVKNSKKIVKEHVEWLHGKMPNERQKEYIKDFKNAPILKWYNEHLKEKGRH